MLGRDGSGPTHGQPFAQANCSKRSDPKHTIGVSPAAGESILMNGAPYMPSLTASATLLINMHADGA